MARRNPRQDETPWAQGYRTFGIVMTAPAASDDWVMGYVTHWAEATGRTIWDGRDGTQPVQITRTATQTRIAVIVR